jgi:hypothetical protein
VPRRIPIRIDCVNKSGRKKIHERIEHLGGPNDDETRWKMSQQEVIEWIESRQGSFYVRHLGHEIDVVVARHNGRKYLKTRADRYEPNNLLALPECP